MPDAELASQEQLKAELRELGSRYPNLKPDARFVLWFLRAYVTDDEQAAAAAICGCAGDKGVDALLIDERSQCVFVIQGKYRSEVGQAREDRGSVMQLAGLSSILAGPEETFREFTGTADPRVADLLRDARTRLLRRQYRLWLYYVTLGRCGTELRREAESFAARTAAGAACRMEVLDGRRLLSLLRDYLDGVAPPVPTLDLEMEAGSGIRVGGTLQRYDQETQIESWVFSMRSHHIARLVESCGVRLFARNIRGFLGTNTPMNRSMLTTLRTEPEHFFYYNNGITIVCDHAKKESSHGRDVLRVGNPQIINGQQTTRILAGHDHHHRPASVLVKVIQVPRDPENRADRFDDLVSRIVAGTNWQNAIRQSDLMTNDRRQIEIERELRKRGYLYLRKRQSKQEAKRAAGSQWRYLVSKEELALAVASCDLDPVRARGGKEHLFGEDLYDQVFPDSDPDRYLPRYWLMRKVSSCSRGRPQWGYAKWLVLNFVWYRLASTLRARARTRAFTALRQTSAWMLDRPLQDAIEAAFRAADRFYRANRGIGERALDPSSFYRNKMGLHRQFREFWNQGTSAAERRLAKLLARVQGVLDEHDALG